ncbi:MAG: DUF2953 domain-containing protein [Bacillota bacterium]|nr:DUF2953 domain-containing protein [Bacillota bacterium]
MLFPVIFIFLIALLLVLIFKLNVYIKIMYLADGGKDHITVTFFALKGKLKVKREVGAKGIKKKGDGKADEDLQKKERSITELYDKFVHLMAVYNSTEILRKYIEEKVHLKEVKIHINIGTGDAFYTGISTGVAWTLVGIVISFFSSRFGDYEKDIMINPDFMEKKLKLDLNCIFKTQIVYIIVIVFKLLYVSKVKKLRVVSGKKIKE